LGHAASDGRTRFIRSARAWLEDRMFENPTEAAESSAEAPAFKAFLRFMAFSLYLTKRNYPLGKRV
jgi:hypothetical protein